MYEFEDYIEKCKKVTSVDELAKLYSHAIYQEGYENCLFTAVRRQELSHVAWFDLPHGYLDTYFEQRWSKIDPVLDCALKARLPFFWNDVVEKTPISRTQSNFMEDCVGLGVHSGIVFPMHGPGERIDVFSISRREREIPDPNSPALLHAISVQTWVRYLELREKEKFQAPDPNQLTPRELEILRWCKHGKTYTDIAEILSISPKTVEFHIINIMDKLGASNKITAIVIAIQRGILDL